MHFASRRAGAVLVLLMSCFGASGQSRRNDHLVYKKKYIMGTVFEIAAYGPSAQQISTAIENAFREIVRIDDLLSNYKPESALSVLNRSAHFHAERVPPELYSVIEQAVHFSRISDGRFDITVAPLVNLWKAALAGDSTPSPAQQHEALACVGYDKLELTPPDQVTFHSPCLQLDLGAIGKGYATDRAADVLRSSGVHDAFISAGGSTILALGSPPGQTAWLVHLRDPSHRADPYIMLTNGSVSTSEQTAATLLGRDSPGHIIDPSSGRPLESQFAVSVVATTGTMSDGLSTTLLLLGPEQGKTLIKQTPDTSSVWVSATAQIQTATNGRQILFGGKL